jgi:hypothetical protein
MFKLYNIEMNANFLSSLSIERVLTTRCRGVVLWIFRRKERTLPRLLAAVEVICTRSPPSPSTADSFKLSCTRRIQTSHQLSIKSHITVQQKCYRWLISYQPDYSFVYSDHDWMYRWRSNEITQSLELRWIIVDGVQWGRWGWSTSNI